MHRAEPLQASAHESQMCSMQGLAHIGLFQEFAPKRPGMGTAASGLDGVGAWSSHLYLNNLCNQSGHSFTFLALKRGISCRNWLV